MNDSRREQERKKWIPSFVHSCWIDNPPALRIADDTAPAYKLSHQANMMAESMIMAEFSEHKITVTVTDNEENADY